MSMQGSLALPAPFRLSPPVARAARIARAAGELAWGVLVLFATVLTTVGIARVVDLFDQTIAATHLATHIGWGTGAGTAAVGDTTLFTEDSGGSPAYARVAVTESQPAADTYRCVATITSNASKTITNAGTFSASSSGTLVVKGDFTGVALLSGDSIQFTIDLQIT